MKRPRSIALLAGVLTLGTCSRDDPPNGLRVTVQVWRQAEQCWATAARPSDWEPVPASSTCAMPATRTLIAGVDDLRLLIDYGDLRFSSAATIPKPTVIFTGDGVVFEAALTVSEARRAGENLYFEAFTEAPLQPVRRLAVEVRAAADFTYVVPDYLTVTEPMGTLVVEQCPMQGGCELQGGVGHAVAVFSWPGRRTRQATVRSAVDGITQSETIPLTANIATTANGVSAVLGRAEVPVPLAREGARWDLWATTAR